jgi:selenocysteine-specific translation elongation factor
MSANLDKQEIRNYIKEVLKNTLDLKELDILLPSNSEWKKEAKDLRSTLVDLMKNIENEDFSDGVKKIDSAIKLLGTWKSKIEKLL